MTPRYSMVIQWSDEDQVFVVTLPEFHGCRTHGDSYEAAARAGQEVLELLVETYAADGRELPLPSTLQALPDGWTKLRLAESGSPGHAGDEAPRALVAAST
jgi:antitoxin HicB